MKNAFLTLLDHIPGHIVHLFNNICQKIQKKPQKTISLYSYIKIQSCFLPLKQNMTCAYVGLNQPILTNNIVTSIHQSIFNFQQHRAKIHHDAPTFQCSNQIPLNVMSRLSILFHSETRHTEVRQLRNAVSSGL